LFRSASVAYGSRVIGVLLSGSLDDGTSGLAAIKRRGGMAIVLDPKDARYQGMPQNAIDAIDVDEILPLKEIAPTLARLVLERAPGSPEAVQDVPDTTETDALLQGRVPDGTPSELTCPECHGALYENTSDGVLRFACHVGHSFSPESLSFAQSESLEGALWMALRALEESARLTERMAKRAEERGAKRSAGRFRARYEDLTLRAGIVRKALLDRDLGPRPDAALHDLGALPADDDDDEDAGVGG
jgi:two-component system chemotaxis response regulator CheB